MNLWRCHSPSAPGAGLTVQSVYKCGGAWPCYQHFYLLPPTLLWQQSGQQIKPKNKQIKWSAEAEVQTALAIK